MINDFIKGLHLIIIEEYNLKHKNKSEQELKDFCDLDFTELDLQENLNSYLRNISKFKKNGDICIPSKDYIMQIRYLRNFNNKCNNRNQKIVWDEAFQKDYDWLIEEIKRGKKGKRVFIIGWFNLEGRRFSDIMQLGIGSGKNPKINKKRMLYFPFLNYNPDTNKINDISYIYNCNLKENDISIPGYNDNKVTCMFIGEKKDKFHFALYY